MKSAKETLAQYRLQGFSDELIELLAMEEKDQNFAQDLLAALHSQDNPEDLQTGEEDNIISDTEDAATSDTAESQELIKSAYKRSGITEEDIELSAVDTGENSENTYIPPELEVIKGGAGEEDPAIIPFLPEYALSPEEHEYAVARSLAFFGEIEHEDEITPRYLSPAETEILAEEDWYVEEVEVAEIEDSAEYTAEPEDVYAEVEVIEIPDTGTVPVEAEEFDCFDFDSIGRSSAREAEPVQKEQEILDLDNSRPAEPEWLEASSRISKEVREIRDWAAGIENNISQASNEKKRLETELNNRNETLVLQGKEMEQLKAVHSGYITQLEQESSLLAAAETSLNNFREESRRTEQMLLKFGAEIELLHGQLFSTNAICQSQSSEIMQKDTIIRELSTACRVLKKQNVEEQTATRESESAYSAELERNNRTIRQLGREIDTLRFQLETATAARSGMTAEFCSLNEDTSTLRTELSRLTRENSSLKQQNQEFETADNKQQRRIRRLEKVREKIKKLEFENNIYRTETVPNLQADKEDLVELASEEYNKVKTLDEISARRARRLSYATSLAAVACLLLVLMPVLSWNNIETEKSSIKSEYSMQLASAEADNLKLEQNLARIQEQLELLDNEYKTARENWSIQLSSLKEQNKAAMQQANIIQAAYNNPENEAQFNVIAFDSNSARENINTQSGFEAEAQYNNVSGLEEYKNELAQAAPNSVDLELLEGKKIQVRKGEGLSQVLWRVYRRSSPEMVSYISNLNKLPIDRRGNPMLKVNQRLILPKDVNTAMANNQNTPSKM